MSSLLHVGRTSSSRSQIIVEILVVKAVVNYTFSQYRVATVQDCIVANLESYLLSRHQLDGASATILGTYIIAHYVIPQECAQYYYSSNFVRKRLLNPKTRRGIVYTYLQLLVILMTYSHFKSATYELVLKTFYGVFLCTAWVNVCWLLSENHPAHVITEWALQLRSRVCTFDKLSLGPLPHKLKSAPSQQLPVSSLVPPTETGWAVKSCRRSGEILWNSTALMEVEHNIIMQ